VLRDTTAAEAPATPVQPMPPADPPAATLTRLDSMRTLPPGIAQSLARLAGVPFAAESAGSPDDRKSAAGDASAPDPAGAGEGPPDAELPPRVRPPLSRRA